MRIATVQEMPQGCLHSRIASDRVAGELDASAVLNLSVDLDGVPKGYAAMDSREAIKDKIRYLCYLH